MMQWRGDAVTARRKDVTQLPVVTTSSPRHCFSQERGTYEPLTTTISFLTERTPSTFRATIDARWLFAGVSAVP